MLLLYPKHQVKNVFAFNIRWMPESARWLIANGKLEEAQTYLKKCAKINRTEELTDTLKPEVSIFQMMGKLTNESQQHNLWPLNYSLNFLIKCFKNNVE